VLGEEQLGDPRPCDGSVALAPGHGLALGDLAFHDAQQRKSAEIGRSVEVGDPRLERCTFVVGRRRDVIEQDRDEFVQVLLVDHAGDDAVRLVEVERGPAITAGAVDDRELDLMLFRVEIEEEFVHLVDDFERARVRAIDLVDHKDDGEVAGECLAQHEPGLRQRAFGGIDQQHDAVDHRQGPFDLAAEVGVTGGVDDVQRDVVVGAIVVPHERGVLRQDRDALLALEIARVHDALGNFLVGTEGAGLVQHCVDEGGLAVVDVGDDRQVANIAATTHVRLVGGSIVIDTRRVVDESLVVGHDKPRYRRDDSPRFASCRINIPKGV